MKIERLKKSMILFFLISISIFANCKENTDIMKFSFEQIQNLYSKEMEQNESSNLCPFYIKKNFFIKVENELNELIAESDFCSVRICVNVDNGILEVNALYDLENEIYFKMWNCNEEKSQTKIQNASARKILRSKPKELVLIDDTKIPIIDGTSTYIIKKIGKDTYYYASYYESNDTSYKPLIDLFREVYKEAL